MRRIKTGPVFMGISQPQSSWISNSDLRKLLAVARAATRWQASKPELVDNVCAYLSYYTTLLNAKPKARKAK